VADAEKLTLFSPGVGKRGMTQLHYDAYYGNLEGLLWCLESGLDVNATDTYRGYTPAHWLADMAAVAGPRVEMLRALAAHGADLNARTPEGITPLMLARMAGSDGGDRLAAELVALGAQDAEPGAATEGGGK
jgi:ankyrin repeat protein